MGRRDYLSKLKYVQIPRLDSYSLVVPSAILGYFCGDMRTCSENPQMSMLAVVALYSLLDRLLTRKPHLFGCRIARLAGNAYAHAQKCLQCRCHSGFVPVRGFVPAELVR